MEYKTDVENLNSLPISYKDDDLPLSMKTVVKVISNAIDRIAELGQRIDILEKWVEELREEVAYQKSVSR